MTQSRHNVTVPSLVTTGNVFDVADGPESALANRIDEVCALRGFSPREWCRRAQLSDGYLAAYRSRTKGGKAKRLPEIGAEKLASVAGINALWLRTGEGQRESAQVIEAPRQLQPEIELAFLDAFGRGHFAAEDGVIARRLASVVGAAMPRERVIATRAMERLLSAVAKLRAGGHHVTLESLTVSLLTQETRSEPAAPPSAEPKRPRRTA